MLEDVEDYYTFYVLILGIPESAFWALDYGALKSIAENKVAYDAWYSDAQARLLEGR